MEYKGAEVKAKLEGKICSYDKSVPDSICAIYLTDMNIFVSEDNYDGTFTDHYVFPISGVADILMEKPTNDLDIETLEWLEQFINNTAYGEGNDIATVNESNTDIDYCGNIDLVKVNPMKKGTKVLIHIIGGVITYGVGSFVGLVTANPLVGTLVGAAIGAGVGALESAIINSHSYNLKALLSR